METYLHNLGVHLEEIGTTCFRFSLSFVKEWTEFITTGWDNNCPRWSYFDFSIVPISSWHCPLLAHECIWKSVLLKWACRFVLACNGICQQIECLGQGEDFDSNELLSAWGYLSIIEVGKMKFLWFACRGLVCWDQMDQSIKLSTQIHSELRTWKRGLILIK